MQHKVVCKLLLKVVCGSSVLLIVLSQVSQSVRLTSALVNNNYCEESSIFCTASASSVSILGICSRHTRSGIAAGGIFYNPEIIGTSCPAGNYCLFLFKS
jgi:hypothetical protein